MDIFNSVESFLEKIFLNLEKDKIDVSDFELDHICYRVETMQEYDELKKELGKTAKLLGEVKVKKRFIASYKLSKPIIFRNRKIWIVEIPQPSEHAFYKSGWQHVEFVMKENFQTFMGKYPQIEFQTGSMGKKINPEIKIEWDDCVVKFHHQSLEYVVTVLEK